jgi:hypothetical protein
MARYFQAKITLTLDFDDKNANLVLLKEIQLNERFVLITVILHIGVIR